MTGRIQPAFVRDDPIMAGAFFSLCGFLWEQPEAHGAFTEATGHKRLPAAKSPLEHLVDQATGAHDSYAEAFIEWVIVNHWGEDEAAPPPPPLTPDEARATTEPNDRTREGPK